MNEHVDIAIIGSGFAGIGAAIRLQQAGFEDYVVLERADDVGGTWRDNSYPGCACDVPSHLYSFSFAPEPGVDASFSPQPEIWAYLRRVADEHGVTAARASAPRSSTPRGTRTAAAGRSRRPPAT